MTESGTAYTHTELICHYLSEKLGSGFFLPRSDWETVQTWLRHTTDPDCIIAILQDIFSQRDKKGLKAPRMSTLHRMMVKKLQALENVRN